MRFLKQDSTLLLFFLSFLLHFQVSNSSSSPLCRKEESFALLQLKHSSSIDEYASVPCETPYPKMKSWKEGADCCTWNGVTCDAVTGHVIGLDLSCSKTVAQIHSNSSLFLLSITLGAFEEKTK
ncbi:hypothetical protein L484_013963 [Morus notabilis]|uniref:Leucine-rich repeat-containing N-terminal plant-type domain-containing protein n=1 Tax=Morus notabilis TaxID=981085 RepID=W9QV60_9ROSA|nr:hypothetical protein L484_013963 [Morus notabilis]